jgi:hypothetical protein
MKLLVLLNFWIGYLRVALVPMEPFFEPITESSLNGRVLAQTRCDLCGGVVSLHDHPHWAVHRQ